MPAKALINATPVPMLQMPVPSNSSLPQSGWSGGSIDYTVHLTNGTDFQILTGELRYGIINKNGTITFQLTDDPNQSKVLTAGTITCFFSQQLPGNNVFNLLVTVTTTLTGTLNMNIDYNVRPNIGQVNIV